MSWRRWNSSRLRSGAMGQSSFSVSSAREHRPVGQDHDLAVVAHHRRRAGGDVEVGGLHLDHRPEQLVDGAGGAARGRRGGAAGRPRARRAARGRGGGAAAAAAPPRRPSPLSSTKPAWVAPSRTSTRTPTDPTPGTATRHSLRPVARPCARLRRHDRRQQLVDGRRGLLRALHLALPRRGDEHDAPARDEPHFLAARLDRRLQDPLDGQLALLGSRTRVIRALRIRWWRPPSRTIRNGSGPVQEVGARGSGAAACR